MKLFWAGLIFGAGYAVGRPDTRAKLAELLQRPEVAKLKEQAASTASTAAKAGQEQLAKAGQKVKEKTAHDSGVVTDPTAPRGGRLLPPFPRRRVQPDAATVPGAGPLDTATGTAAHDTSTSAGLVNDMPAAPSTASPGMPDETIPPSGR